MTFQGVTHVALTVPALRPAEEFYCNLFQLAVAFREGETTEGWAALRDEHGWAEVESAGITLGLVMLHRPGLNLSLEAGTGGTNPGILSHIGLQCDEGELTRLQALAPDRGCTVLTARADLLVIRDPFGVQWELTTNAYDDPRRYSHGVRNGRWIDLPPRRQVSQPAQ